VSYPKQRSPLLATHGLGASIDERPHVLSALGTQPLTSAVLLATRSV